jgi:hypothetical protein
MSLKTSTAKEMASFTDITSFLKSNGSSKNEIIII